METQKNTEKTTSENLLNKIKVLQDQKKLLAERLIVAKKLEIFQSSFLDLDKKDQKFKWEHVHFENVGILQVLTNEKFVNEKKIQYDFEGNYAFQNLTNMKEQNSLLGIYNEDNHEK